VTVGLVIFAALFALTTRRGATDPVCHMNVDRSKALTLAHNGHTYCFCSDGCRGAFQANPDRYTDQDRRTTRRRSAAA
jgi:YHS domain-containing protein